MLVLVLELVLALKQDRALQQPQQEASYPHVHARSQQIATS